MSNEDKLRHLILELYGEAMAGCCTNGMDMFNFSGMFRSDRIRKIKEELDKVLNECNISSRDI